jgi:protocatechuate 3,4-dioxygenase beta subunit
VATARIALRVGAAVSGLVIEAGGGPIAGARVTAFVAGDQLGGEVLDQPAVTDAEGRFHIPALAPGAYRFRARHRGHLDGTTTRSVDAAIADVRIEMARGARVSGRVVDGRGAPAPWASVVLGASMTREQLGERHGQRTSADQTGAFRLEGVPPRIFSVMASGEEATSQAVEVDLTRGDRDGLVLRLDVDGRIAGTVVDDAGRPVAEAVVEAVPDFMAGGVSDGQMIGGVAQTTTDGDGGFAFRGRPEGKYRLVAGRTGSERQNPLEVGVRAATGDLAVRLVVSTPGRVRGRVRFADGSAPQAFSVQVGRRPPLAMASRAGEFTIPEVDPGPQRLLVRGTGFAPATGRVDVAAGAERDAGVILLERGRTVRGRVLGAGGRPVAGALVVAGPRVHAGASSLIHPLAADERSGVRATTSDGDGRFELTGLEPADVVVAAEHEREGRSPAVTAAHGVDRPVDLPLAAFASVHGTVSRSGRPSAGQVSATQRGTRLHVAFEAGEDGAYDLARLAAGEYTITGPINGHPGEQTVTRSVRLEPGQRLQVDLAVDDAGPSLIVSLKPAADRPTAPAHVSVVTGSVSPTTVREMTDLGLTPSSVRHGMSTDGESRFAGLRPGPYTVCVTPMPDAPADPIAAARFFEHPERVPVQCTAVTVAPAPPEQRTTAVMPAMPAP